MPFKRPAQLRNHLHQQHGTQAAANSVFTTSDNTDSTAETLDCPELTSTNSVNGFYYNSSLATVFDVGQQLQSSDVIAEEADCTVRQCEILPTQCHSSETIEATDITGCQLSVVSSVSDACDGIGFSVSDKSITVVPQSLDYAHNSSSMSESDLLFSEERTDSLPLPIPSLAEDSITDVIATSHADSFSLVDDSSLPSFNRPEITDTTYLPWHVNFADVMCSATVPLPSDELQTIISVWSSLVTDMTAAVMSGWQQHYPALLDVVRKLGATVESHLEHLQPTGTTQSHE